jgi:hypothetical protein
MLKKISQPRRRMLLHPFALAAMLFIAGAAAADPALKPGTPLDLSGMLSVGGREFRASEFAHRAFLVFSSNRRNADSSRRWGDALGDRFGDNLAKWDEERGEPILIVPVLDLSGASSLMPKSLVANMIKLMGGGNGVLLDWKGDVSHKIGAPSDQAALILIGPDLRVQALVTGDYSPPAAKDLFAAIDADIKRLPHAPSAPAASASPAH